VQVLKAGVLEIADVFVVNKSDHPMALQLQREIRSMMEMLSFEGWIPKLVSTQAVEGKGIDKLWDAVVQHDAWLRETGAIERKRREAFAHRVRQLALGTLEGRVESVIAELPDDLDPYAAASEVLERFNVRDGIHAHAQARVHGAVRAHVKGL
jgi:LAO/AO transport system kinase